MPKASNKIYASNASRPELQALCEERGLNFLNEQNKSLTSDKLRALLDEHESKRVLATVSLDFANKEPALEQGDDNQVHDEVISTNTSDIVEIAQQGAPSTDANAGIETVINLSHEVHVNDITDRTGIQPATLLAADVNQPPGYGDLKANLSESDTPQDGPKSNLRPVAENFASSHHDDFPFPPISLKSVTGELPATVNEEGAVNAGSKTLLTGPFYLQILVRNLGFYLSRGVLYPLSLESDSERNSVRLVDLLTQFPDFLPLSRGPLTGFSESQVLLEVHLLPNELMRVQPVGNLYCLAEAVPVSRIRSLYFYSMDSAADFKADTELDKNWFCPDSIIQLITDESFPEPIAVSVGQVANGEPLAPDPQWPHIMRQFDRQLGLFGYLKHAPLLRANKDQRVQDFPDELLVGLHMLNTAVVTNPQVNKAVMNTLLRQSVPPPNTAAQFLFAALIKAVYDNEEASFPWAQSLLREVEKQCNHLQKVPNDLAQLRATQKEIELLQRDQGNFQSALANIARSDSSGASIPRVPFAALVLLSKYPGRARAAEDKQSVLTFLAKYADRGNLTAPALDQILAVLGLYYGYAKLTRQDPNLNIKDPTLSAAAQPLHRIRFDIDRFADRFIIESVFRYAVEDRPIHDTLNYLLPDAVNDEQVKLPQREYHQLSNAALNKTPQPNPVLAFPPSKQNQIKQAYTNQAPKPIEGMDKNLALHQEIIRKMIGWYTPAHFEQQLENGFTETERALLRQLIQQEKYA